MPKTYRVSRQEVDRGGRIEQKEHHVSERAGRKIARDHLKEHPDYYKLEPVFEKMLEAREKKEGIKPIKKKPPQREYNPMIDGLPDIRLPY